MEENKPIVGNLCFIHESDVHVQAILQGLWNAFEPFLPEVVGQKRQSYFGSTTDRESVEVLAQNLGISLEKKALDEIMVKIKDKIEEKGYASEEEVGEFIKNI
jgi:methanogen homocitrate synthase